MSTFQTIFLRSLTNEAEDLKNELQVEDGDNIYFIPGNFSAYYEEKDILGEGTSGTVKECVKNSTQERFAVKITRYRGDTELLHCVTLFIILVRYNLIRLSKSSRTIENLIIKILSKSMSSI